MVEPFIVIKPDSEVNSIDIVKYFVYGMNYEDREELINWICCQARKAGFNIKIDKFDSGFRRRKLKFVLGCERGGEYKGTKNLRREETSSRKYICPLSLCCYISASKQWCLGGVSGLHDHKMEPKLEGHVLVGR